MNIFKLLYNLIRLILAVRNENYFQPYWYNFFVGFSYINLESEGLTATKIERRLRKQKRAKKRFFPLVIKRNQLQDRAKYRFKLCAAYGDEVLCAEEDVETAGAPSQGNL